MPSRPTCYIENFSNLKIELANQFHFQMYYDKFNQLKFIAPKNPNKLIYKLLDSYTDDVTFACKECDQLHSLLKEIHLEDEHTQGDLIRLYVIANSANFSCNNLKINKNNGECEYV